MTHYIIDSKNYAAYPNVPLGGKAKNLFLLQSAGIQVPEFICVSAQAYTQATTHIQAQINARLDACDFNSLASLTATSQAIKALILDCDLDNDLKAQLEHSLQQLQPWDRFSVRSSAVNEDGAQSSFAGQLGTWLNVSRENVVARIKDCWASAFEPGILTYIHKRTDTRHDTNAVAVVIQRMIDAGSSGVMFQADPQHGIDKLAIVAGYGLGEGIVGDKVETDAYLYHKQSGEWQLTVNEKQRYLCYHPEGGTCEQPLAEHLRTQPVLTDAQRFELLQASNRIAALYDSYQDIEWSYDQDGQLYILQSRPITTIPQGHERVFDNSNIIESYPGVILPMTFSIVRLDYYHCMKGTMLKLGIPADTIDRREEVLKHLVGYINGRTYYNISNWYRVFLTLPYFKQRFIEYFEQMVGTDGSFSETLDDVPLSLIEKLKIAVMFPLKFLYHSLRHNHLISQYFATTSQIRREFEAIDLANAGSDELIGALQNFVDRFTKAMTVPLLNDFFAMFFMAVTREQFAKAGLADGETLVNRLLANQYIESTKPVDSLKQLINEVRADATLSGYLQNLQQQPELNQPDRLAQALTQQGYKTFSQQLKQHIDDYGHRSPKELIMEANTFRENPFQLLAILVESASLNQPATPETDDAGQQLEQSLQNHKRGRWLKWLLKKTRQAIAHREATRLDRGLHFSFFRTLLHRIGDRMVNENVLMARDDIFYLTVPELNDYRQGCAVNDDLKRLIELRKTQAQRWQQKQQEGKIFTRGSVYANTIPDSHLNLQINPDSLKGVGCSDGQVSSVARIISDPSQEMDIKGKIMVSETTDPGWVFLMTLSAGLISERGSLLSHTAIIGRELGIPTIVGVKNATRYIQDGSTISMDGKTGEIQLQNPEDKPTSTAAEAAVSEA
ncbi:PEP/pyruvate-binding domain-containing protein [Gynuella sunshinyii]|uniref:Phosphoenolpyruvate synthase/pyruvate phosphate dikinase n=1 Tax=Gynuella sunshinyii YC6258 TaxID=1445510 RepID=A0A0C5W3H8_9GAMM|nr:PEP/pyruvate-binding domain-containing protein [Gynuella sunshinyii]AJQ97184.1 phosphoenolpyruvate synthase/pyruvate phosphate dikinase [Gynuella sunshinyii YC6258]